MVGELLSILHRVSSNYHYDLRPGCGKKFLTFQVKGSIIFTKCLSDVRGSRGGYWHRRLLQSGVNSEGVQFCV